MIRYERPPVPTSFAADVAAARQAFESAIPPAGTPLDPSAWRKVEASPAWGAFKSILAVAQHSKCAYCERANTSHGDVEHFLPKKIVDQVRDAGVEEPDARVSGRRGSGEVAPGYWWMAYEWRNYLFACNHCNSKWKRNFVAVDPAHDRSDPPSQQRSERVDMLNPFDDDPLDHIRVDEYGVMFPLSEKGRRSIEVYGLNRPTLLPHREAASRSGRALATLLLPSDPDRSNADLQRSLHPRLMFQAAFRCGVAEALGGDQLAWRIVRELTRTR